MSKQFTRTYNPLTDDKFQVARIPNNAAIIPSVSTEDLIADPGKPTLQYNPITGEYIAWYPDRGVYASLGGGGSIDYALVTEDQTIDDNYLGFTYDGSALTEDFTITVLPDLEDGTTFGINIVNADVASTNFVTVPLTAETGVWSYSGMDTLKIPFAYNGTYVIQKIGGLWSLISGMGAATTPLPAESGGDVTLYTTPNYGLVNNPTRLRSFKIVGENHDMDYQTIMIPLAPDYGTTYTTTQKVRITLVPFNSPNSVPLSFTLEVSPTGILGDTQIIIDKFKEVSVTAIRHTDVKSTIYPDKTYQSPILFISGIPGAYDTKVQVEVTWLGGLSPEDYQVDDVMDELLALSCQLTATTNGVESVITPLPEQIQYLTGQITPKPLIWEYDHIPVWFVKQSTRVNDNPQLITYQDHSRRLTPMFADRWIIDNIDNVTVSGKTIKPNSNVGGSIDLVQYITTEDLDSPVDISGSISAVVDFDLGDRSDIINNGVMVSFDVWNDDSRGWSVGQLKPLNPLGLFNGYNSYIKDNPLKIRIRIVFDGTRLTAITLNSINAYLNSNTLLSNVASVDVSSDKIKCYRYFQKIKVLTTEFDKSINPTAITTVPCLPTLSNASITLDLTGFSDAYSGVFVNIEDTNLTEGAIVLENTSGGETKISAGGLVTIDTGW